MHKTACLPFVAAAILLAMPPGSTWAQSASRAAEPLGRGPPDMQMKLEKTWFKIDVATVDIWFGDATRDRLRSLAAGRDYSSGLANRIAAAAMAADNAFVQLRFERDVSLDRFLEGARSNLERARRAGMLEGNSVQQAFREVQQAFSRFSGRGFEDGDRLLYHARPSSLRTRVVAKDGRLLLDVVSDEASAPRIMLAGYFAPGSDFREPLIRSLLR